MVFRIILLIFVILIISINADTAELYLIKKANKTNIAFTAEEKIKYKIKLMKPGVVRIILFNTKAPEKRLIFGEKSIIKEISIKQIDANSVITVRLQPDYLIKSKEEYPPFKLILIPVKLSASKTWELLIEEAIKEKDCEEILNLTDNIPVKLSEKKKLSLEKYRFKCALELREYQKALNALNSILKKEKDEKLLVKRIELLLKLKKYNEAVAEGTLFMKRYTDTLREYVATLMAEALIKLDRTEDAIVLLKEILSQNPQSPYLAEIYKTLAKAYYKKRNYIASFLLFENSYQKKRKTVEEDPEALFMYGRCAVKLNQNKKAVKLLLEVFNKYPKSEEAPKCLVLIGDVYRNINNWNLAKWFYEICLSLFPETEAAAISKIHIAEYYENKKDYRKALNIYTETMMLYPKYKKVLEVAIFRRGVVLLKLKKFEEAIDAFREFILKFPESKYIKDAENYIEEAEFGIAKRDFKEKRWEEALKKLANFAIRYPENPHTKEAIKLAGEALIKICEDKYKRKDCFGIAFFWENYKNFFPKEKETATALFHIASCLLKQNKVKEAVKELEWIYQHVGEEFKYKKALLELLARAYTKQENYLKLRHVLEKLVKEYSPQEAKNAYEMLMRYYFSTGRLKLLSKLKERLNKFKEEDLLNLLKFYQGMSLIEKNNVKNGLELLETFLENKRSLSLYPEYFEYAKITTARVYFNHKDYTHSIIHYSEFANIFPKSKYTPEALFMIGYMEKGKNRTFFWERCLKEFPKSYWSKEIKARNLARSIQQEAANIE